MLPLQVLLTVTLHSHTTILTLIFFRINKIIHKYRKLHASKISQMSQQDAEFTFIICWKRRATTINFDQRMLWFSVKSGHIQIVLYCIRASALKRTHGWVGGPRVKKPVSYEELWTMKWQETDLTWRNSLGTNIRPRPDSRSSEWGSLESRPTCQGRKQVFGTEPILSEGN